MYPKFSHGSSTLHIWDSDQDYKVGLDNVILWRQFTRDKTSQYVFAIHDLIENNATGIRTKLLEYIYQVGQGISNRQILRMRLDSNFNYFWMTHFHSRTYTPEGQLYELAKIFALLGVIQSNNFENITLHTRDRSLASVIQNVAAEYRIGMTAVSTNSKHLENTLKLKIKGITPNPLIALFSLLSATRVSVIIRSRSNVKQSDASISIIDYWYRFADSVEADRDFKSQYWTSLVESLHKTNVNWIHHIVDQRTTESLKRAKSLLHDFNHASKTQHHTILDGQISLKIFIKTLLRYFKLAALSLPISKYKQSFTLQDTKINLWPLFQRKWRESLRGSEAMINCLRYSRIEGALANANKQRLGVYLMENQPWEMALIHLWRKYGHGQLIGVAHSTIRFWDLRFFSDSRRFSEHTSSQMPRPDLVAVNGQLARGSLLDAGYHKEQLVDVEALMYLHLAKKPSKSTTGSQTTILVATDYLESATRAQLSLINELLETNPVDFQFLLKPHWSQAFTNLHPRIEIVPGTHDLSTYFDKCDVLYCSSITSAVIDGICAGVPVIQCLDPESFNLSPLRGHPDVQVVRTAKELAHAINTIENFTPTIDPNSIFNLELDLRRWNSLLIGKEVTDQQI